MHYNAFAVVKLFLIKAGIFSAKRKKLFRKANYANKRFFFFKLGNI